MDKTSVRTDRCLEYAISLWKRLGRAAGSVKANSENNYLFTFAESCTGGMLASLVTSVAGVSEVFPGSAVTYSNDMKRRLLEVPANTLERHGAVSAQCAADMARGALRKFGTLIAVSVTGIAGPGGGSVEKPVGTVWFAVAHSDGTIRLRRGYYPGRTRRRTQERAALSALEMLLGALSYEISKFEK